jgi:hypothetical protein
LQRLAGHHVLRLGQIAEHVEVLDPVDLARQLSAATRFVILVSLCANRVEDGSGGLPEPDGSLDPQSSGRWTAVAR